MKIHFMLKKELKENDVFIIYTPRNKELIKCFQLLLNEMMKTIKVYDDEHNIYYIPLIKIYYIEALDPYCYIHTESDVYQIESTLKKIVNQTQEFGFVQINARTIINLHYIQSYCILEECHRKVLLYNQQQFIVNRSYIKQFEALMKQLKGGVEK